MCLYVVSVFHRNLLKNLKLRWASTFYYTDKRYHPVYTFRNVVPFQSDPCIERGSLNQTPKLYKYMPLTFLF